MMKLFFCLGLTVGVLAPAASAAIISVSGSGDILVPDATPNTGATANFFNDTGANILVHGWNEQQVVTLDRDITVDIVAPGTYSAPFTSANAVIPLGTLISSHLLYFDPLGNATATATFEFDADIIGVIVLSDLPGDDRLLSTDFLGHPLTVYPGAHFDNRAIEFGPEDITLNAGLRSITVALAASSPGDQIRVITQAVPEPTAWLLMSGGLAAVAWLRRRR